MIFFFSFRLTLFYSYYKLGKKDIWKAVCLGWVAEFKFGRFISLEKKLVGLFCILNFNFLAK